MSATSEPFQNAPMKISLALNVVLALGIAALLLPAPDAPSTGSSISRDAPAVVAAGEVTHAGKFSYSGPADVKRLGRFKREAAPPATSGEIAPAVTYKSSAARATARTP